MSHETCPHAETTTLLWIAGEADGAHAEHVAGCDDCTAVLTLHSEVAVALGPLVDQLDRAGLPSVEDHEQPVAVEAPANTWRWGLLAAAAAIALLGVGWFGLSPAVPDGTPDNLVVDVQPGAPEAPRISVRPDAPALAQQDATEPERAVERALEGVDLSAPDAPDAPERVAQVDGNAADPDLSALFGSDLDALIDDLDAFEASLASL